MRRMQSGASFAGNQAVQQRKMNGVAMRWLWSAVAGAVIGLSVLGIATASAEPTQPPAPGPTTSSSDELADMVMDVVQHGEPAAPTTTPVPAPPH
jgi:hypothetical protein